MKRSRLIGIVCLLLGIVYFNCTSPSGLANNGGSEVVGKLVDKNGNAVNNAQVKAFKSVSNSDSFAFNRSVLSGPDGTYKFDELDSGFYNLVCKAQVGTDSLFANIYNVNNDTIAPPNQPAHQLNLGIDTMLPPGTISGRVHLDYDTAMSGVLCYIPGTSYNAVTGDSGNFKISKIPVGAYTVYFKFIGAELSFAQATILNIHVRSNLDTNIGIINMHLSGDGNPPTPLGLRSAYDSLTGKVVLSWDTVPIPNFKFFVVYRADSNMSPTGSNTGETASGQDNG